MFTVKKAKKSDIPAGIRLSKTNKKLPRSSKEYFPLTKMNVGDYFIAEGYTARDLRGVIHKKSRTKGAKFRAFTEYGYRGYTSYESGPDFHTFVLRVK